MLKYISAYAETNKEKFNMNLINAKSDKNIINDITQLFKMLEQIPTVHVKNIRIDRHEEQFGPIREKGQYYKAVRQTRLNKVHFSIDIDGLEHRIEQDLFMLKLLDNNYYINEGTRYFPIWQIVPNFSIHTNNGVLLKPLTNLTSIIDTTANKQESNNYIAEDGKMLLNDVKLFEALIFSKSLPILFYYMGKFSIDIYNRERINSIDDVERRNTYMTTELLDKFNEYFNVDVELSMDPDELKGDDSRVVFKQEDGGLSFSMPKHQAKSTNGKIVVGMLLGSRDVSIKSKKKKAKALTFTVNEFNTPSFWLNIIGSVFTRGNDPYKKYRKANSIFISADRLVDDNVKKMLPVDPKWKENFYNLAYFTVRNFDKLMKKDNMDLRNMRLSLNEYILYPLRVKFANKINQISNQPNVTPDDVYKIFKKMSSMFLISSLVNSGLIHIYESTNEMSVFSQTLKCTFVGPAGGAGKNLTVNQRDIQPSFNCRLDLVYASPGNPGPTSILTPFQNLKENKFCNEIITDDAD